MGQKKGIHIAFFYKERVYRMNSPMARIIYYDEEGNLHGRARANYRDYGLKTLMDFYHGKKNGEFELYSMEGKDPYVCKLFKEGKEVTAPAN
jgi:antitoxin component YwqK of YwqJK toxin-antitoxin module